MLLCGCFGTGRDLVQQPIDNSPQPQRTFRALFGFEAAVRSGYQIGKTPVLPVFAASLGASDALLGVIVTASVCTGLLLKPFVGAMSDQTGRRPWLWAAAALFVLMPFAYVWVDDPQSLTAVRLVHGLSTAMLGPVALATIASLSREGIAERFGWYGMARSLSVVIGPALGGWLLLSLKPEEIYPWIGALSLLGLLPLAMLPRLPALQPRTRTGTLTERLQRGLVSLLTQLSLVARSRPVWSAGGIEALLYVATYALKTFLPVYAVRHGVHIGWVGTALAAQEGVAMWLRPLTGRQADRYGHTSSVAAGLIGVGGGLGLLLLLLAQGERIGLALLLPAAIIGLGQALMLSATTAWVACDARKEHLGAAMGLMGAARNIGKISGPVIGGLLVSSVGFLNTMSLAALLLILAGSLGLSIVNRPSRLPESGP